MPAVPAPALPSFSTIEPVVLDSTMLPLPAVVIRSDWAASLTVELVMLPSALTRLTVMLTSSIVTPFVSSRYMPPDVARALSVATVVSRWSMVSPTPTEALSLKPDAVMLSRLSLAPTTRASASTMLPPCAVRLTLPPVLMSPTVMLVAASTRIAPLTLVIRLSAA